MLDPLEVHLLDFPNIVITGGCVLGGVRVWACVGVCGSVWECVRVLQGPGVTTELSGVPLFCARCWLLLHDVS
jgi:hypothetical protein